MLIDTPTNPPSYNQVQPPLSGNNSQSNAESFDQTPISTSSGVQLSRDANLLIRHYLPLPEITGPEQQRQQQHQNQLHQQTSRDSSTGPLPLPLCIPQISVSADWDSPFARGYNDNLHSIGINQQTLLNFIDGLNLAIQASPPLRVVSLVGTILGFVPYHWAMIAGTALTVAAQTGMKVLSKTLTDRYLRAANVNLFHPKGLSVRLCTTPAMLLLLSLDQNENENNKNKTGKKREKLNKFGRGVGSLVLKSPIPIPLASTIVRAMADKPPTVPVVEGETMKGSVLRRRLAVLQGQEGHGDLALPLMLDGMPPSAEIRGVMDRMSDWGVKADNWSANRKELKNEERRRALKRIDEEAGGANVWSGRRPILGRGSGSDVKNPEPESTQSASGNSFKELASRASGYINQRRMQRDIDTEMMYRSRRGLPIVGLLGKSESPMQRKVAEEDLMERWATDKVLWIVIMGVEHDSQIDGIGMAESFDEEERVDEGTWRNEMMQERAQMEEDMEEEARKEKSRR